MQEKQIFETGSSVSKRVWLESGIRLSFRSFFTEKLHKATHESRLSSFATLLFEKILSIDTSPLFVHE